MVIFYFCFRSQEDVHKVEITHEKPEKFVDKVFCLFWQTKLTCVVSDPGNIERSSVYSSPRFPGLGSDYGGLRYNTFCTCKLAEYFMKFIKNTLCRAVSPPRQWRKTKYCKSGWGKNASVQGRERASSPLSPSLLSQSLKQAKVVQGRCRGLVDRASDLRPQ